MFVARVILMSAMLTAGIVETTKNTVPHVTEGSTGEAPMAAPRTAPAAAPVSTIPAADPVCAGATWPYLPESCLRSGTPREAAPRRPVRMIEEQQRPTAPARIPGRVSVG